MKQGELKFVVYFGTMSLADLEVLAQKTLMSTQDKIGL